MQLPLKICVGNNKAVRRPNGVYLECSPLCHLQDTKGWAIQSLVRNRREKGKSGKRGRKIELRRQANPVVVMQTLPLINGDDTDQEPRSERQTSPLINADDTDQE